VHRTRLDCDRGVDGGLLANVIGDREDNPVRAGRAINVLSAPVAREPGLYVSRIAALRDGPPAGNGCLAAD
jgi:hypothetical protein